MIDPRASAVSVVPEGRIAQDFVTSPEESSRSRLALVARELELYFKSGESVQSFRVSWVAAPDTSFSRIDTRVGEYFLSIASPRAPCKQGQVSAPKSCRSVCSAWWATAPKAPEWLKAARITRQQLSSSSH